MQQRRLLSSMRNTRARTLQKLGLSASFLLSLPTAADAAAASLRGMPGRAWPCPEPLGGIGRWRVGLPLVPELVATGLCRRQRWQACKVPLPLELVNLCILLHTRPGSDVFLKAQYPPARGRAEARASQLLLCLGTLPAFALHGNIRCTLSTRLAARVSSLRFKSFSNWIMSYDVVCSKQQQYPSAQSSNQSAVGPHVPSS